MMNPGLRRWASVSARPSALALALLALLSRAVVAQTAADTESAVFAAGRMEARRYGTSDGREYALHPGIFGPQVDAAFLKGMKQAGRRAGMQSTRTRPDAIVITLRDLRVSIADILDSALVTIETEHCNPKSGAWYRNAMRYPLVRVKHGGSRKDEWIAGERPMLIKATDGTCSVPATGETAQSTPPHP